MSVLVTCANPFLGGQNTLKGIVTVATTKARRSYGFAQCMTFKNQDANPKKMGNEYSKLKNL